MTKLTAVNQILRKSGVPGAVTTLNADGRSNAAEAERCLDEEELRIQTEGWYYNTRRNVELTPDGNSRFALPNAVITIDTDSGDYHMNVTQLGGHLYDLDNNTDVFGASTLRVRYVLRYDFECIPEPVAQYIAAQAALTYYENMPPPREALRIRTLMETRDRAQGVAKAFNGKSADANILSTPDAQAVKGRSWQGGLRGYVRGL